MEEVEAPSVAPLPSNIQAIDKGSVHRICSGQVVLTLATAVKELVENSLDAGASSIEVRLRDHGSELIEVIDNGCGVEENNFEGLTLKHHTSKLKDFSDLVDVETFGFRGEALSSLSALSNVTIVTCHEKTDVGTKLEYDHNGKMMKKTPFPRQKGTTVSLQNLFYTLPVRHKEFLKNVKKEFAKMVQVLNAYSIISTGVRISCTNQVGKGKKNVVLATTSNSSIKENVANIYGPKQVKSLLDFKQLNPNELVCEEYGLKVPEGRGVFRVEGVVSTPQHGCGRGSSDRQFCFINKRPCDFVKVFKVVNEVYHQYNRHQYPVVVLDISLDKDCVDVNVTPDKRQIFVQEEKLLLAIIKTSLIQIFEPQASVYQLGQAQKSLGMQMPTQLKSQTSSPLPEKKSTLSLTLANLKRSFSSAFSREQPTDNSAKQRRMDTFFTKKEAVMNGDASQGSEFTATDHHETAQDNNDSVLDSDLSSSLTITEHVSNTTDTCLSYETDSFSEKTMEDSDTMNISQISKRSEVENCEASPTLLEEKNTFLKTDGRIIDNRDPSECHLSTGGTSEDQLEDECGSHEQTSSSSVLEIRVPSIETPSSLSQTTDRDWSEDSEDCIISVDATLAENTSERKEMTERNDRCNSEDVPDVSVTYTEYDIAGGKNKKEAKLPFSMSALRKSMENKKSVVAAAAEKFCRSFRAKINPTDNQSAEDELQREISKDMFANMKVLGQFNLGFIIARLEDDLFIVDQHATDEKYNFEMLQRHTVLQSQKLIHPQSLELTAANETILMDNLPIFRQNGFECTVKEDAPPTQRIRLVSMPVSRNWTFGKDDIEELIFMLTDSPGVMCRPSRVRQMFASRACRKSIMVGTALKKTEMKKLLQHMGEIEQPWNCPHGRPTMRHLINLKMLPE